MGEGEGWYKAQQQQTKRNSATQESHKKCKAEFEPAGKRLPVQSASFFSQNNPLVSDLGQYARGWVGLCSLFDSPKMGVHGDVLTRRSLRKYRAIFCPTLKREV